MYYGMWGFFPPLLPDVAYTTPQKLPPLSTGRRRTTTTTPAEWSMC
ncbi:Hypothetical protein, putative [Bodo saltans]|uniref:Uncharacterized protein n=1 Tax=Bodo saltans TaxID=75058 RepID=A0A0S4JH20_BODSA|nr:Hypothetical protein, putative [Bodo saltans]|eukprot:CUG89405.1 Hypothetical protein, putative [Bodo saltans]